MNTKRFCLLLAGALSSFWLVQPGNAQQSDSSIFPVERNIQGKRLAFKAKFMPVSWDVSVFVNDGLLLYKNRREHLRVFNLSTLGVQADLGGWEDFDTPFMYPYFSPASADSLFCYIMDEGQVFQANKDLQVAKTKQRIFSFEYEFGGNLARMVKDFACWRDSSWLFAGKSGQGFSLFETVGQGKNTVTREFLPLSVEAGKKDWQACLGSLVVSSDGKKAVYAYNYYHTIRFIDLERKTVHSIEQPGTPFDYATIDKADGLDLNVRHYQQCYAGEKYVYFLHIGRKPTTFRRDNANRNTYVCIEQFDWEGNPVQRMWLDKFGAFFAVDEKAGKLYLVSLTNVGSPFYEYTISL